jgi:hypothetical protein
MVEDPDRLRALFERHRATIAAFRAKPDQSDTRDLGASVGHDVAAAISRLQSDINNADDLHLTAEAVEKLTAALAEARDLENQLPIAARRSWRGYWP